MILRMRICPRSKIKKPPQSDFLVEEAFAKGGNSDKFAVIPSHGQSYQMDRERQKHKLTEII
jgi:hypothetical protein